MCDNYEVQLQERDQLCRQLMVDGETAHRTHVVATDRFQDTLQGQALRHAAYVTQLRARYGCRAPRRTYSRYLSAARHFNRSCPTMG